MAGARSITSSPYERPVRKVAASQSSSVEMPLANCRGLRSRAASSALRSR
ncbi:MAG: hypothetical protein IPJ65_39035 [Archangiaceae bacterium]|nr:hypothetical protein [Archangiaceae bacterium]